MNLVRTWDPRHGVNSVWSRCDTYETVPIREKKVVTITVLSGIRRVPFMFRFACVAAALTFEPASRSTRLAIHSVSSVGRLQVRAACLTSDATQDAPWRLTYGDWRMVPAASSLYHLTPVETQNSFCSGSAILTHRVPPKLCGLSSMR